jgi:hypothetical protein
MYITINKEQINLDKIHSTYREYFYDIEILPNEIKFWGRYNFDLINLISKRFNIKFIVTDNNSIEGSTQHNNGYDNRLKITFNLS